MSERSTAPAVPSADSPDPSGAAPNNTDDSPSATADHEASSPTAEAPDDEAATVDSPGTSGSDRDAGDTTDSVGDGETVSDTASAADSRAVVEPVTDSDATAVQSGASPAADPEIDSIVARAATAAAAAALAANAAATAADAAADAAAAAADAAEAAAVAADLAVTAVRGCLAGTGADDETKTDDDVPEDAGGEAAACSDTPGDETFAEAQAEPRARGIVAWGADRRRDLLAYICVPLVTLFAAPALVLFLGIVILGSSTGSPAICDEVRAVNGCEEATWDVIGAHVLGFLVLWALLWALPWRRGLRTPRVLLALAASVFLFAGLLRLAA
ncbi:hypothetical protein KZ829_27200 [Actinoplanes hulinensis]|uniref:Uncharacterized protein n=1 Tax=Actinoplanes hulinensis TaxID=1144547 RepID=A0ABS7B8N0_9ACTN|nr:hypothetical protein [Actinoplanes hulinensis]MBW6437425.1 hypothetical protein [Actinoplanes hulinensis]